MVKKRIYKLIILSLLVSSIFFISLNRVLAYGSSVSDPTLQFNQSEQPSVIFGGNPSGNYNDLNALGEGLTYDIPKVLDGSLYRVEVWHNSSQITDGNILSTNVTLNFTTNVSDSYSLQIYDFADSQWTSDGCNSGSVLADAPTQWWCNETSNPMHYNSSDRRIMIRINSTADTNNSLLKEDYVQYYVGYEAGYLDVSIINPDPSLTTNVIQNYDFPVNVTVTCKNGPCGEVLGTIRYNLSSSSPDTAISTTAGAKPFYIQETPSSALKSCGTLYKDQNCQLNWTLNATGDVSTVWKIDVLFNSTYDEVQENHTSDVVASILSCTVDIDALWSSINFGLLNPSTGPYNAPGNSDNEYNIAVKEGSCNSSLYISGTDMTGDSSLIGVGNVTWSNVSNSYPSSFSLSKANQTIQLNVPQKTNATTWYWINVPAVYAGYYNGTITISGVKNE